jgi:hypothetical protein
VHENKWGNASEKAAFAAHLELAKKSSSSGPPSLGPAPYTPIGDSFYGATPAQVKADPTKFAPKWTNANPAKPKAQFLVKNTASGAWVEVEVTGYQYDPLADEPILFTPTPVAEIPPFQWTPERLEGGF